MIKSEDEQLVDILFCGIKDEPCEKTVDFTSIESAQVFDTIMDSSTAWWSRGNVVKLRTKDTQTCDEVCELFGGPPTRWEKIKAFIRLNILARLKLLRKKIINITYVKFTYFDSSYEAYSLYITLFKNLL